MSKSSALMPVCACSKAKASRRRPAGVSMIRMISQARTRLDRVGPYCLQHDCGDAASPDGLVHSPAFSHVAVIPSGVATIYVGGQNAVDASGTLVGADDIAGQPAQVMANLKTALAAAGASMSDLVSCTILFVDGG